MRVKRIVSGGKQQKETQSQMEWNMEHLETDVNDALCETNSDTQH